MKRIIVLMVALSILATGCGPAVPSCTRADYMAVVKPLSQQWDDAAAVAQSSARIALAGPVGNLQNIYRQTQALSLPTCYSSAHSHLLTAEDATIRGFLAFMSQDQVTSSQLFAQANQETTTWAKALELLP